MRDMTIFHDLLKNQCPHLHKKRRGSLRVAVQSLLDGQQLSLTEPLATAGLSLIRLGREVKKPALRLVFSCAVALFFNRDSV